MTVDVADGVADVRLNRPEKLNALDGEMFVAVADAAARLARDRSVRAVVLSGEGPAFSAGLDVAAFRAGAPGGRGAGGGDGRPAGGGGEPGLLGPGSLGRTDGRTTHLGQQAAHGWAEVPVPVIAAVWGHCLGGGLQIALGADLRIVHPGASLAVLEIRWGLSPDMTGTATLPRLVGVDVAKELTWTGRTVSGTEAVELGLCTRTSEDPLAEALSLAWEIAGRSPRAVRGTKRLLEQSGRVPLAQQYADERRTVASLIGGPDQREAVAAFLGGRAPSFADPA
ncbi:MAG TPA: crotonase/enoyl-CoA hydratase family protein [Acidimicrobiales bacterium]|nr:crotonase/enoyl-CoA hydratase family protein [Acidimicrobiales bacterium]